MPQKEIIIEASLQQFLEHGIKQMTIQKLIEPLGLSTKTVYKYFADKEDWTPSNKETFSLTPSTAM